MIPKIIHYCWLSSDPFPDEIKSCIDSWKKILPDYEFKLWNFSCFDMEYSQWVKEAFLFRKYAFAADYIRMYALYNYGGVYLDSDVQVLKSYNDLLHLPYFIGRERTQNADDIAIEAATMGFEKGHPLLKNILDYYDARRFHIKGRKFNTLQLPHILLEHAQKTHILKKIVSVEGFDYNPAVLSLFPEDYFSPKSWFTQKTEVTNDTYSIHHFIGSWTKRKIWTERMMVLRYRVLGMFVKKYKGI